MLIGGSVVTSCSLHVLLSTCGVCPGLCARERGQQKQTNYFRYVRALLAKSLSTLTQEGRPEPVVEVCARSEHCSLRGVPSKYFFRREWIRRCPGFLRMRPILYEEISSKTDEISQIYVYI